jgi:hypothetical protein
VICVLDTNSLSVLRNYYPATFPTLWVNLDGLVANGDLVSVREALRELENDNRVTFVQEWAKKNKAVFYTPTDAELEVVGQILAIPHFQTVISGKALLKGTPVADPFIIASAFVKNATVITEEVYRPNAAKIPNICEHFDVDCHNLEWFMAQHGWEF